MRDCNVINWADGKRLFTVHLEGLPRIGERLSEPDTAEGGWVVVAVGDLVGPLLAPEPVIYVEPAGGARPLTSLGREVDNPHHIPVRAPNNTGNG